MVDRLKQQLSLGDVVALAYHNQLVIGQIEKFHPKMITVKALRGGMSYKKYPQDLVKLEGPRLTAWMLTI